MEEFDQTHRLAGQLFGAHLTTRHIEENRIDATSLAAEANVSGLERIERALAETGEKAAQKIDECVRTVLRRLSGLPERGSRSVIVDCPFARAWWRGRLLSDIVKGDDNLSAIVQDVLYSQPNLLGDPN